MVELAAGTIRRAWERRRLGIASAVVAALVVAVATTVAVRALLYRTAVLPGVTVAGIDVGGLERAEARARIEAVLTARLEEPVRVEAGTATITVEPRELFELDATATERLAFEAGRESAWSRALAVALPLALEREVDPVVSVQAPGRAALARELARLTRPAVAARVEMNRLEPVVYEARPGSHVGAAAVVDLIASAALAGRGTVVAELEAARPAVQTAEAEEAAAEAKRMLAGPVGITFRDKSVGKLSPATLARAIRFERVNGDYAAVLAPEPLARALAPMVADFTAEPVDAAFRVSGNRVRIVPSRPGTQVAPRKAASAIAAALQLDGPRTVPIVLTRRYADFTTAEARALGIRERVSTFTTEMGPSTSNRIWNVQLLGRYLDGTILKPRQTFSFNKVMGPRTPERGFREGQMIFGGVLIPSIGGGVCQVATTIFNAAFEAGLPIAKRRNHSFYISHYPVGRDATVSWGGPDLVFKNDLDGPILIKASGNSETFTVSFYGTRQGRRVVARTSERTNYTSPRLQYAIDPSAPAGSVRTTGGGGPGFDVTVFRTVHERGRVIRKDKFFTRYLPENPTQVHGPGATPPGPYFILPTGA